MDNRHHQKKGYKAQVPESFLAAVGHRHEEKEVVDAGNRPSDAWRGPGAWLARAFSGNPLSPGCGTGGANPTRSTMPHSTVTSFHSALLCSHFALNAASSARLKFLDFLPQLLSGPTYFYLLCCGWETADSNTAKEQPAQCKVPQSVRELQPAI